ncbi:putative BURP domain-containing protein 3 [Iris pallida]|uniref:BURP domain-containing protein 3 n=1 Tax=Iris pallida TaxID=29817 RepID=A0AAX6ID84_IRIPA|nr:putative BURP domain-containing protein 3 [Iris pallida]
MGRFLLFLSLFAVVATATDEALHAQTYWKKALPNTKMPAAIKDIIQHVDVKRVNKEENDQVAIPVNRAAGDKAGGSEDILECFIRCTRSEELAPGLKVPIHFLKTTSGLGVRFLPRHSAASTPFSSAKLPDILARFSVKPGSAEAGYIADTLRECEAPADAGETKLCATSLESMVEYVTSSLGTRDVATLTTVVDRKEEAPSQEYTVSAVKELTGTGGFVACHALKYPYAVYYCHTSSRTTAYRVSMVGADGTRVEAMVACHMTTCHFLPQDHVIWTANK